MEPADLDIEDKNIIGGIDLLIISAGIAVLAVLPTLFIVIFMPWRAASLLAGERPLGREGYILGPGIFFVAAILSTFVLVSTMPNDDAEPSPAAIEQVAPDTSALDQPKSAFRTGFEAGARAKRQDEDDEDDGPGIGSRIMEGFASGNIWQAAASISPFFFGACLIAGLSAAWGAILRMPGWTLRAAMGGALYFAASCTVVVVFIASTLKFFYGAEGADLPNGILLLFVVLLFLPLLVLPWQTFWFVKNYTGETAHKSGLVTLGTTVSLLAIVTTMSVISTVGFIQSGGLQSPPADIQDAAVEITAAPIIAEEAAPAPEEDIAVQQATPIAPEEE